MKYGDTLPQRSIPLWATYNIDYNEIKHLIKVRTTKDQAQTITIPGHENEARALRDFEDELYNELRQQHQRIDLFVQSKSGEIARRLTHLGKQVAQLKQRDGFSEQAKISVRRLERFSKAEDAILKVGDDIQALSRFVGAQRLAFQKLLKKYKKWTSSSDLGKRFRMEVLDQLTSFTRMDFDPLLAHWAEVLAAVRAPFQAGTNWQSRSAEKTQGSVEADRSGNKLLPNSKPSPGPNPHGPLQDDRGPTSSAKDIHSMCENGSNLDFDIALAVLPLGRTAGKAVYWVHPDNLIQVQVLLLQHTRLYKTGNTTPSPPNASSQRSSRSGSINSHWSTAASRADEETGVIICDELEQFARRQSSTTVSDSENLPGSASEKAAACIRYCSTGEAVAVVSILSEPTDRSMPKKSRFEQAKLKKKAVRQLFSTDPSLSCKRRQSPQSVAGNDGAGKELDTGQDDEMIRAWFSVHSKVQPLVELYMRRTRFVGLGNSDAGGLWATIDKDVLVKRCTKEDLTGDAGPFTFIEEGETGCEKFPYALLEIRREGQTATDLIASLDGSHLTERVRGFSLETHAVATLYKPHGMPAPFWLPALKQDIRKVPASAKNTRPKTATTMISSESARTQRTSTSATSFGEGPSGSGFSAQPSGSLPTSATDMLESPPLSAFKKKRRLHKNHAVSGYINQASRPPQQRYWNEFDDGDEGSEEEVYTIFVDPNKSDNFPGAAMVSKLAASIASGVKDSSQRVRSWLSLEPKPAPNERDPLLNDYFSHPASVDYDTDPDDDLSPESGTKDPRRHYSTFPDRHHETVSRSRETLLFRFCIAAFGASFVLLGLAATLTSTGRRKSGLALNIGVMVGVVCSLLFAMVGIGTMLARTTNLGWMHRAAVLLILAIVCVGNGVLLAISQDS